MDTDFFDFIISYLPCAAIVLLRPFHQRHSLDPIT
jgi:hypothetical protein